MKPDERSVLCWVSILFKLSLWSACVDHVVDNLERHSIKKFAAGASGSRDAFTAIGLIVSIVSLTHEILALLGEELIINPIHRHRHMTTTIHISVKLAFIIDDKTFFVRALDRKQKFFRFAWL